LLFINFGERVSLISKILLKVSISISSNLSPLLLILSEFIKETFFISFLYPEVMLSKSSPSRIEFSIESIFLKYSSLTILFPIKISGDNFRYLNLFALLR